MDPLTHALTSLAAARAVQEWLPRRGAAIVVIAGVAPDLDYASKWAGAESFLRFHRGALHGILGATILACAIAALACLASRHYLDKRAPSALRYFPALIASALGVSTHLALDYFSGPGLMLLWPWSSSWWGREIVRDFDPWLLAFLIAGLFLPLLFGLVSDEIGERRKGPTGGDAAILTLVVLVAYFSLRADLRVRAVHLLMSNEFHGRAPLAAGAFPFSWNPFEWRGVVSTESTIEVVLVPSNQASFDPDRSVTHYKPPDSPALEIAVKTNAAAQFLRYAWFPLASVQQTQAGPHVEFRDLRFEPSDSTADNLRAIVVLDSSLHVEEEELTFAAKSDWP